MAQLNVYVPKALEDKIKKEAKREGKSVSAFVLQIVQEKIQPKVWSKPFLETFGSLGSDFPDDIEDLPPQKRPGLDDL
jgi:hypothetical protein